jgi:O-methyltransferase involved in polyketide biosynthesis
MVAARARQNEQVDRLFDDPLAAVLADTEGFAWLEQMGLRRRRTRGCTLGLPPLPVLA